MEATMIRKLHLALVLALASAPAFAAEDPASPTATAPASSSVADQIDAFIRSSPVNEIPQDGQPLGVTSSSGPREPHGVVSVGVGNHGYRSIYMRSDMPIGETGTLSVAIGDTRFNGGFGGWGHRSLGVGSERCGGPMAGSLLSPRWPAEALSCSDAGR
jgi:hypothetical protein